MATMYRATFSTGYTLTRAAKCSHAWYARVTVKDGTYLKTGFVRSERAAQEAVARWAARGQAVTEIVAVTPVTAI